MADESPVSRLVDPWSRCPQELQWSGRQGLTRGAPAGYMDSDNRTDNVIPASDARLVPVVSMVDPHWEPGVSCWQEIPLATMIGMYLPEGSRHVAVGERLSGFWAIGVRM